MKTVIGQRLQSRVAIFVILILAVIAVSLRSALPSYGLMLVTKALVFGLFAASLDILVGYTGLVSLGHAAFFGVAGYTTGLFIMQLQIRSFWLNGVAGVVAAVVTAAIFGLFVFRARGLLFLLLTFALGQMLYSGVIKWTHITGGYYGMFGVPPPQLGLDIRWTAGNLYLFVLLVSSISLYMLYRVSRSPFALMLKAIRDQEDRLPSLGYDTWRYKYVAYIVSALFAGISGVLFVSYNSLITPEQVGVNMSTLGLLMVILGGSGTIFGPVVGAFIIVFTEYYASIFLPERWPLVLGALFVITSMFARGGIWGIGNALWRRVVRRSWNRLESNI